MVWPFFSTEDAVKASVDETYECDYERDCTPLYRAIESAIVPEEFAPIVKYLDSGYWPGSFFADGTVPSVQAKTWVTRFDPDDANKVKWSQLPLHLAIVCGAPTSIVGRLVKLYPQALRCTDDQHMLPLHLALRHNASDEVVAYLIMQFPDAVNASGKNGRTAVECALRAKDKLRGKILELFIEKCKGKKSSAIVKEQNQLKADLVVKDEEVTQLKADLEAMAANFEAIKTLKTACETDLLTKIQDVELSKIEYEVEATEKMEKLESDKLLESLELHKKLATMEAIKSELESSEKQARTGEAVLRDELAAINGRIAKASSAAHWDSIKVDVVGMEAHRLERSRTATKTQIVALKEELKKTLLEAQKIDPLLDGGTFDIEEAASKVELETELLSLQLNVSKLEKGEAVAKTSEDFNALRAEVDLLRAELKERAVSSQTKLELIVLKKAMEMELRNSQGKTEEELANLRKAVETAGANKLENRTNAELVALKMDLEMLKRESKNKELVSKTTTELNDLCDNLQNEMKTANAKVKAELTSMKKNADQLKVHLEKVDSTNGVIQIKKAIEALKDDLKKKDTSAKILDEVHILKTTLETELKKAEGKTQEELLAMKKQIKALNEKELAAKDFNELTKIKADLINVKHGLKEIEKASMVQQELDALKKTLAAEMKSTAAKAEQELAMMKKAVDEVNLEQKESKKLKKSLTEEIKEANKKTEQELLVLKNTLDSIDVKKLESTNKDGWEAIRIEMDDFKTELAAKKANPEITLELASIKQAVDELNLANMEQKSESEFKTLRQEMDVMRATMQLKDVGEAVLKRELDILKQTEAAKKKKGLSKFFARHFSHRKKSEDAAAAERRSNDASKATKETTKDGKTSSRVSLSGAASPANSRLQPDFDQVSTISPPSMVHRRVVEDDSSDDSSLDGSTSTAGIMSKLSVTYTNDAAPAVETVHTVEEPEQQIVKTASKGVVGKASSKESAQTASATLTKQTTPSGNIMRKVVSMDPRIASQRAIQQAIRHSLSKTVMEASGDIELEATDTIEDEVLIRAPSQASQLAFP